MRATRRIASQLDPTTGVARQATPAHLEPAGPGHAGIESPAVLLQARLDAAIAVSPWVGHDAQSAVDHWPGAVRVAVLIGGASASWALAWQLLQLSF